MEKQLICPRVYHKLVLRVKRKVSFCLVLSCFVCFCFFFKVGMVKGKDRDFQGKREMEFRFNHSSGYTSQETLWSRG